MKQNRTVEVIAIVLSPTVEAYLETFSGGERKYQKRLFKIGNYVYSTASVIIYVFDTIGASHYFLY